MIRLLGGYATDSGRIRSNNQDRVAMVDGRLYAVADGMGGHRGGEVAAEITALGLENSVDPTGALNSDLLVQTIRALNTQVLARADQSDDLYGMGTTLTGVALSVATTRSNEQVVTVFNVGDSRTYLLRNSELQQLTEDHSVIADLLRTGQITADQARTHKQRSVVTRAIGAETEIDVDIIEVLPVPGTRYLLCSDGLTGELSDQIIGSILRRLADPTAAAKELVRLANENGGRDNVTVVVVDVVDDAGFDQAAMDASSHVQPTRHAETESVAVAPNTGNSFNAAAAGPNTTTAKRVRAPFPITVRVLVFFAIVAALAAAVVAVLKNSPTTDPVIDTTVGSVSATSPSSTSPGSTSSTGPGVSLITQPTTTVDDFATPTTPTTVRTAVRSATKKRTR